VTAEAPDARELVLVDASNVVRSDVFVQLLRERELPRDGLHELSASLLDLAASWAARSGVELDLVYDGVGPPRQLGHVARSWHGGDADAAIATRAREAHAAGRHVRLITDDRALAQAAASHYRRRAHVAEFVAEFAAGDATADAEPTRPEHRHRAPRPSPVANSLSDDVRARLERLRRGETP
jgi:hypothetical protein